MGFFARAPRSGDQLTAFELMPRIGLEIALRHARACSDPLAATHPWYVLMELSSSQREAASTRHAGAVARRSARGRAGRATARHRGKHRPGAALWRMREGDGRGAEARGRQHQARRLGAGQHASPSSSSRRHAAVGERLPGIRPVAFGHVGDGNIHYNLIQPVGADTAHVPGALGRIQPHRPRHRRRPRRLDQRRARHRPAEARRAGALQSAGRARADAQDQARARSRRDHKSRQDPVPP